MTDLADYIVPLDRLSMADVPRVGGKNASLGEMIRSLAGAGVQVPGGFATTAQAFWDFLDHNGLRERIHAKLAALDVADVTALAAAGAEIRGWVGAAALPAALEAGLDADEMQKLVLSGKYTDFVYEQVQEASQIGVSGVPTYVINDRYAIVGAQPYEVFKNALGRILSLK